MHIFNHCMFMKPLLGAFLDLCDHLQHHGAANRMFSPRDMVMGTLQGKTLSPGLLLFLFDLQKFYWIEYCACKYGDQTVFRAPEIIWKEITYRVRSRILAFVGECTRQTRFIRYRAGRGKPHLKEYRLRKYVIKEWNRKVQPLGTMILTETGVKFTPIIEWDDIAARLG